MTTREYAGPFRAVSPLREAWDTAEASARAVMRPYPRPPGRVHGVAPGDFYSHPERHSTYFLTAPIMRQTDVYLPVTAEMKRAPAGTVEVRGRDVEPARSGAEIDTDEFTGKADERPVVEIGEVIPDKDLVRI